MFALDINEHHLRVLELVKQQGTFTLRGLGEKGYASRDNVARILKDLTLNTKPQPLLSHDVAIAIPEEESFTKLIHIDSDAKKDLSETIEEEIGKILPYEKDDVYWDWRALESDKNNDTTNIMVIASPRSVVDGYIDIVKEAGFSPGLIETEPNALLWGVSNPFEQKPQDQAILIVNIGDEKTTIVTALKGAIRVSTSMKITLSSSPSRDYLAMEWDQWIKTNKKNWAPTEKNLLALMQKLREHIDYYHDHLVSKTDKEQQTIGKVIVSGSWASFPEILEFIGQKLALPVARPDYMVPIHPTYTTALGLALRGLSEEYAEI